MKGQKVVCINDQFEPWVYKIYAEVPKKDSTYTVRDVYIGKQDLKDKDGGSVGITLKEIRNPIDPTCKSGPQELGFNSERFAPLEELDSEIENVEELVEAL
ncbi:hypothetical protein EBR43_07995 [bacterium]|nr:hypothetical protein [bacterium]